MRDEWIFLELQLRVTGERGTVPLLRGGALRQNVGYAGMVFIFDKNISNAFLISH